MHWRFEAEVKLEAIETEVTGPQGLRIRLRPKAGAGRVGTVEGGVSFECRNTPLTEGCYTLIYNLRRDPPQETTRIDSDQYECKQNTEYAAVNGAMTSLNTNGEWAKSY